MDEISQEPPDFFISRAGAHSADVAMAAKVGQIIQAEGHRVVLQQWDFANRNFMERMDAASASGARVVGILTPQYLASDYCAAEWIHALDGDPLNRKGRLIVLRAAECEPKGLLRTLAYWDLEPIRGRDDLLADIVKSAILSDAERRLSGTAGAHWREARALLHEVIWPTPSFTGRAEHLRKIGDALWSGKNEVTAITQPATVTGLGGIGKSTLAREYAWQAQDRYAGVWWLNSASDSDTESWEGIEQGLVSVGDHYIRGLAQVEDREKAARHALDFLAHGGFTKPWLLIFDNVDDPRALEMWRPRGNVHTLVTSRIGNWRSGVAPIEVDAWAPAEAIAYLVQETGRADFSKVELANLAEALGRLPLALSHAAAYLRRRKAVTIRDYVGDLDRHMSELPKDAEYRNPVYATFRAALGQAEQEAPGATALMSLAAFFAPDDIPEELFQQDAALYPPDLAHVIADPASLADTLGVLDDLSIIDFEPETRTFSTHRIVQAAARDALGSGRDAWVPRAVGIAFSAFPEPAPETRPQCARLVTHVRALNSHVPAEAGTSELGWLLTTAGEYSLGRAALTDVLPLFKGAHNIFERLATADLGNAEWQRALTVSHNKIGGVLVLQGNLSDALAEHKASLAIAERFATTDPGNVGWQRDLSIAHDRIGDVFVQQGKLRDALAAYKAAHLIAKRLATADPGNAGWQRDLSVSHTSIGGVLVRQGDLPNALAAYKAALAIRERLATADPGNVEWQRDLSTAHSNIGNVLLAQGNLSNALAAYKGSLVIAERLATADPGDAGLQDDLSDVHDEIAEVLVGQGNLSDALAAYKTSLAIRERLATADPANAGWQRNLSVSHDRMGDIFVHQGNLPDALAPYKASLAMAKRLTTADSENAGWQRDLSISHNKIGDLLVRQGKLPHALAAYKTALAIAKHLATADPGNAGWQRDLSIAYLKIGHVLRAQGNLLDALATFKIFLTMAEGLATADPGNADWQRDVAIGNERLGEIYSEQENSMEERKAFERALGAYEELITRNPGDVQSQVYSVVPRWRLSRLDPINARHHLESALAILKLLAAADRLDSDRVTWIEQIQRELSEL